MAGPLITTPAGRVELSWIPLGAGGHSVRFNGVLYEAVAAALAHRARCDIYHSALSIVRPEGTYWVEMTPVPDQFGEQRGVVATGPVGLRGLGRARLFRYEIRRWREGIVPDLAYAVASPVTITDDPAVAGDIFDELGEVPPPVWGLDELDAGEMWTCNSVISWTLTRAHVDLDVVGLPPGGRAPGWDAGRIVASRSTRTRRSARLTNG